MKNVVRLFFVIAALFSSMFSTSLAASAKTETNIHYTLLQAYDAFGNYWVELPGVTYSNVLSPDKLDPVTRYQWQITVNARGNVGSNGRLVDGWIQTHTVGTGYSFETPAVYVTNLVYQNDPRFKNSGQVGPTANGWGYSVYVSSGWGNLLPKLQEKIAEVHLNLKG